MSVQVILIRHGETDWNRIKRIQGHRDIPLSAHGVEQAAQLAARFAGPDCALSPAAIYCSDLLRARQTAAPMAAALGLPVQLDTGLRERAYGVFEGLDSAAIGARYPLEYAQWQSRDPAFTPEGGESHQDFYERVTETLRTLVARHPGACIVCVAHGGVLDCVYRLVSRLPLHQPRQHALLNASINVVEFDTAGDRVVTWADITHLVSDSSDEVIDERVERRSV